MKKTTKFLKLLCVLALFIGSKNVQAQCATNFVYNVSPGGVVNFSATTTFSVNQLNWNFGNGTTSSSSSPTLAFSPSATYSVSGNYIVTLMAVGACSAISTQSINVTVTSSTVCAINADFSTIVQNNGTVQFNDSTSGAVSGITYYNVDFGDGSSSGSFSSSYIAPHNYAANGVYTATLTASVNGMTPACTSTATTTFTVNTVCTSPLSVTLTNVQSAGNVTVTATATGTVAGSTYAWNIYNGGTNSSVVNTSSQMTYTGLVNGQANIYVYVTNPLPSCSAFGSNTITINSSTLCNVTAGFYQNQTQGSVVNFNNTSTGTGSGVTYFWDFGDGTTSTTASPTHTYPANGTYTVSMIVNNNITPACADTQIVALVVNSGCFINTSFTYSQGTNGNVVFTNTSGTYTATTINWNFGDGGTSTSMNPSHIFSSGTYTVSLSVSGPTYIPWCSDTDSQVLVITNTCVANASFSMVPSGTPQYWYAVPGSSVGVANATWNWGDGSGTSGLFSSHTYSAAGTYSICLTVTLTCGDVDTFCYNAAISKSMQDNGIIQVEAIDASNIATGIKNNGTKNSAYNVSPNPSTGLVTVNINGLTSAKAKVNVYNLVGKLVYESENETSNGALVKEINLDAMSNGVYFIKVSADNKIYTKKLIINK